MARIRAIAATYVAAMLLGCASTHDAPQSLPQTASARPSESQQEKPRSRDIQTANPCRAGAFVEASSIVNSVVEIAMALPPNTPERTRAELDAVLYTALKQAKSEVHCVVGALSFGYERAYAGVIKRGVGLAQSRRLSKDIVDLGNELVSTLEANKHVAPSIESRRGVSAEKSK
ncbi:MAG: hypothetical protein ACRDAM_22000 [Casimicrobium sp.]